MDKETLIIFIKRLLEGSQAKASLSLCQLRQILETQGADPQMIKIVSDTIKSIPEAKIAARSSKFNEEELMIAIARAEDRRRREAEMADRGRC